MLRIAVVLAPGFEEIEAVTAVDLLRRAGVAVTLLGLGSREVTGSHGIAVISDMPFSGFSGPSDGIVLPGGMPGTKNLAAAGPLLELIRETDRQGRLCAAICAAPMVLARAGIMSGRRCTCYPGFEKEMGDATVVDEEVVRDRNVITGRGAGAAVPFALELVSCLVSAAAAEKVKRSIVYK